MNEEQARAILGDTVQENGTLYNLGHYISWPSYGNMQMIILDCVFTVEELEAIVWWVRNKRP